MVLSGTSPMTREVKMEKIEVIRVGDARYESRDGHYQIVKSCSMWNIFKRTETDHKNWIPCGAASSLRSARYIIAGWQEREAKKVNA